MIRLIQRRLIIPRGDTGSFSIPVLSKGGTDNIAVFTIFDETTRTKMFQKIISGEGDVLTIAFTHSDTVNLKPGKYVWDIKYYKNPEYIDDELVNGEEIDSYYAGFSLPVCEIRETADNYLVSPEAPTATLSPEQLEIVTGAIHSLNEAIRKTQENVEHYPEIRDEVWYVWDAELGDYVSTGVRANGIVGNGIASAVLNNDYTLTLNFTDGTSFTSPSIRGETGNGIDDIVLNNNFTLTISYTDGGSYTTPSIRGPIGPTPQFSIGTVQDGAVAAASVTGTAENPVLNLTLPNAHVPTRVSQLENDAGYLTQHQDLSDYVQKTDYATTSEAGVVKIMNNSAGGIDIVNNQYLRIAGATDAHVKSGSSLYRPIVPNLQHISAFYGLAKAAGDTTQSQSSNAVGTYTNEAKAAIQTMLDVPSNEEMNTAIGTAIGNINSFDMAVVQTLPTQDISTHTIYLVPKTGETNDVYDEYVYINNNWEMVGNTQIDLSDYALKSELPDVPVQDVQIDGSSIISNGVASIPVGSNDNFGVYKTGSYGITVMNMPGYEGTLAISSAASSEIKASNGLFKVITPSSQHRSVFYGLAKAAGDSTQSVSENAVGTYTDEAKAAIQQMLDVPSTNDIPVESGTGVGSVKTKPYILDNAIENNLALGIGSFAVGASAVAIGNGSFAAADSFAKGTLSHAEGYHLFLNISISGEENSTEYSFESTSNLAIDDYLVSFDRSLVAQITSVDNENKMIVISQTFGDICDNLPIAVYRTGAFGNQSHAEGVRTLASNQAAHAEGRTTIAKGIASHAEGRSSEANGSYSHAEGYGTNANGNYSHAEGTYTWATGTYSHVEGHRSYALGSCAHAEGNHGNAWYIYLTNGNSENEYLFTIVAENVIAKPGDIIDLNGVIRFITSVTDQTLTLQNAFEEPCDNTQAVLYTSGAFGAGSHVEGHSTIAQGMYQHVQGKYNVSDNEGVYADIVGNGSNDLNHSNAYVLTWTGDGKYAGDVYVHANADSTGGTKLATIEDIPDAPVQDVQVNGVSVLGQDGVANVPVATYDTLGTIKLSPTGQTSSGAYGLHIENGALMIVSAAENIIKAGTDSFRPITAKRIGAAAFYGLSKVAGVDLANETVTLGTYPETSKTAIKAMLGVQDGLKVVRLI